MAIISNLIARLRADTAAFDSKMNRSRKNLSSFTLGVRTMGRQMLAIAGVGGGLYALKRGFDSILKAAMEQEKAERTLKAAVQGSIGTFKTYAANLQTLTVYGDEQILSEMAYAKNLGVTTDKLKEATTAAIGLAARYRIDLSSAMMLVGRAAQGQTQLLTRYGIVIDQNLSDQEKFNRLLTIGAASFRLAREETRTAAGALQQMHNAFGDLKEMMGTELLPVVTKIAQTLTESAREGGATAEFVREQAEGIAAIIEGVEALDKKRKEMAKQRAVGEFEKKKSLGLTEPVLPGKDWYMQNPEKIAEGIRAWEKMGRIAPTWMYQYKKQSEEMEQLITEARKFDQTQKEVARTARDVNEEVENYIKSVQEYDRSLEGQLARRIKGMDSERNSIAKNVKAILEEINIVGRLADSFTDAFDRMIFEGEQFGDAMKSIFRSIAREVMRVLIFKPLATQISDLIGSTFGLDLSGAARPEMAQTAAVYPAHAEGGLFTKPHLGWIAEEEPELITPLSRLGQFFPQRQAVNIVIKNEGIPLQQKGEAYWDADQLILNVVNKNLDTNISFRRKIAGLTTSRI